MKVEISKDDIKTGKVDSEGRKYLSRDLAGKHVEVAILDVSEPDE